LGTGNFGFGHQRLLEQTSRRCRSLSLPPARPILAGSKCGRTSAPRLSHALQINCGSISESLTLIGWHFNRVRA
jgi:hypothetical protein